MTFLAATPALPVRDVARAVAFYGERLGFESPHVDPGFAVMRRDRVEIHLWEANNPSCPGAEPFLAGSASCRVRVTGLPQLYAEFQAQGVVRPNGALATRPWGVDDFSILDIDGNAIGFDAPTGADS